MWAKKGEYRCISTYFDVYLLSAPKYDPRSSFFCIGINMLMKTIQDNGYKMVKYFLACMTSAKKQSLASQYKSYTLAHEKKHKIDLLKARKAQEDDYYSRRMSVEYPKA